MRFVLSQLFVTSVPKLVYLWVLRPAFALTFYLFFDFYNREGFRAELMPLWLRLG
ncbi:hypothetical protein HCTETULN_108 [Candidatus Hodgkinia cicadicola]|nr:hypothetical protein HCTETULN_108 [Candidatus Hodgkinia cicadicola]